MRFLAIGVLTSEVATTETIFNWANALKSRTDYLIVRNHRNGDDFSALESSEPGQRFLKVSKAPMIDMEARLDDIQRDLDKRGLSLRQALEAPSEIAGPFSFKGGVQDQDARIPHPDERAIPTRGRHATAMSADPTNGQSNIDVILKAMAPDRREFVEGSLCRRSAGCKARPLSRLARQ